ncbi:MAG: pyruvate kinase [Actinomycetes bacterium]
MRSTKIVATIGPASRDPEVLVRMVSAGMDVARLNFSHGTPEEHAENISRIRDAANRAGRPVAVLQDLPGPKLRIGPLKESRAELVAGERVELVCGEEFEGDSRRMSITWEGLAEALSPGDAVYLADGLVRLNVEAVNGESGVVTLVVEAGGPVGGRGGLNLPGEAASLPSASEDDLELLRFGEKAGVDLVALSFVRTAADIAVVREETRLPIVAKIEKPQAVERAEEVIAAADAVMVARGDLGIELPLPQVPLVQKRLIDLAGRLARPAITATQMLDSMVSSPRPTRAEVGDVANAILDGTDAVMLSQETAIGRYPVEAIAMMDAIARETEPSLPIERWNEERVHRDARDPAYSIAHTAAESARDLELAALIIPTLSGRSVRLVSAHRPCVPIYALSPGRETVRRCVLMWGVKAAEMRRHEVTEELIADAAKRALEEGWVKPGDRVGITAGLPSGRPGTTSLFQVQTIR